MLIFAETVYDMTHLIDAERLKTFVQARRDMYYNHYVKIGAGCIAECKYEEDVELLDLIESLQQEQPMPDSTQLIEFWHKDKEMLKEKDFRDDAWRLAYIAFMCGFGRGISVKKQEQPAVDLEKEIIRYQREDMDRDTTVGDVARHFYKLGLNARKEEQK